MAKYREKGSGMVFQAEQFNPRNQILPGVAIAFLTDNAFTYIKIKAWPDEQGIQPRDMSWGYITDRVPKRTHVFHGDWLVQTETGDILVYRDAVFQEHFERIEHMAELYGEMTIKIHPEMTEEGKALLRQMIREEIEAYIRNEQLIARDLQHDRLPPKHLDFEVKHD